MKKIFYVCFILLVGTLVFSACHNESMIESGGTRGEGELDLSSLKMEVNLKMDTVDLGSRALSAVDFSQYVVSIYNQQSQQVGQWTYATMPEIISLEVGSYTITVASSAEQTSGFDAPYYKGNASFEIQENKVTEVPVIICSLANMLFTVVYDEKFEGLMGEDVVTTVTVGENTLSIPLSETRNAYLAAPQAENLSMTVTLKGTIDGEMIDYSQRFENVKAGVHNIIRYKFDTVNEGTSKEGTLDVTIEVDSSLDGSDEVVAVDPGEEPNIDDFPNKGDEGEGGDTEQNQPAIVGTNFNGNTFDIVNDVLNVPANLEGNIPLMVTLKASNGIAHVFVTIDSETLTEDMLVGVGLAKSFDLAEPGSLADGLGSLGFPTGDQVVGQSEILFDITNFTPLLGLYGVATHNFIIRVVDQKGLEVTQTLKIKSV